MASRSTSDAYVGYASSERPTDPGHTTFIARLGMGTHASLPQPTPNFSKDISGGDAFDPTGREFRGMSAWGRSQMKDFTVYHHSAAAHG